MFRFTQYDLQEDRPRLSTISRVPTPPTFPLQFAVISFLHKIETTSRRMLHAFPFSLHIIIFSSFFPLPPLSGYIYVGHTWDMPRFHKQEPCFVFYLMYVLGSCSSMACVGLVFNYPLVCSRSSAYVTVHVRLELAVGGSQPPTPSDAWRKKRSRIRSVTRPVTKPVLLFFGNRK